MSGPLRPWMDRWVSLWRGKDPERNAPLRMDDPIGGAIDDAEILLCFAAQSRRSIKKERIKALTEAVGAVVESRRLQQAPTPDQLTAFWTAYDELAVEMAPLSAQSIRASMSFNATRFPHSLLTSTGINAFLAFIVFVICIGLQGIWAAGRALLDKADALNQQIVQVEQREQHSRIVQARLQARLQRVSRELCPPHGCSADALGRLPDSGPALPKSMVPVSSPPAVLSKDSELRLNAERRQIVDALDEESSRSAEQYNELKTLTDRSKSLIEPIHEWYAKALALCDRIDSLCPIIVQPPSVETTPAPLSGEASPYEQFRHERQIEQQRTKAFRENLHRAQLILDNLATYWLPLFMGLLGALAYILRSLTLQLRDHTYVPTSISVLVVRMCLGAVAGVFGAMLALGPDPSLKSVPPLFVPFVFGYGIEVMFSLMDQVVGSFTRGNGSGGQKAAA